MFLTENFVFNGISNSSMNIYLCDFDSTILNEIGFEFKRSLNRYDSFKNNPMYEEENESNYEIELNLLLYDMTNKVKLTWTNEIIKEIYDWLITDNFCEFYSEDNPDVVYYFKVTSIQKVFTPDRKGYLKVIFQNIDEYCYIKKNFTATINGNAILSVPNPSNKQYKPIIRITNRGTTTTINKVNDLEIKQINTNKTVTIDNLICTVESDTKENLFSCCNRKWVCLESGENELKLSGNMMIEIICLFPIII